MKRIMSMALAAVLVLLLCTACHNEPAESGSTESRPSDGAESVSDRSDSASAAESEDNGESGSSSDAPADGTTAAVTPGSTGGAVSGSNTAGNGGSVPAAGTTGRGGSTAGGKGTQTTKSTTRTTAGTKETIPPRPDVDTDHLSLTPDEDEADYLCASTSKNAAAENSIWL